MDINHFSKIPSYITDGIFQFVYLTGNIHPDMKNIQLVCKSWNKIFKEKTLVWLTRRLNSKDFIANFKRYCLLFFQMDNNKTLELPERDKIHNIVAKKLYYSFF